MPQRIAIRARRGRGRDTIGRHMRIKLIVNPASGGESALDHLSAINARLRQAGDVDIVLTTGDGDAVEAGRRAVLDGCEQVFVAGGDGTLNSTTNRSPSASPMARTRPARSRCSPSPCATRG
jgi:hypothetical protein